ncbi:hypothetical protein CK203_094861 [Vitis vinifera]|uniref:Uncharacterized protein n=1 Tax=Vitis vinifera TaxID=29760 RepID=A0A438DCF3_VITVI|nr:hypothetical protein CK203_094861 [Vitis vinifera]
MSENKTKKDRCSLWLKEAARYGAEPVEPVPNRFSWCSSWLTEAASYGAEPLNRFRTGSDGWCSSWLTEAASYGAEPVEPVPNRFSRCSAWLTEAASYGAELIEPVPNLFSRAEASPTLSTQEMLLTFCSSHQQDFPSPKCPSTEIPFISMGTTPLITSLRLTRPAHSLQFFQLASPPRIHMDS